MKQNQFSIFKKYSILIGVLLVPIIYSFSYLKAYWNPYRNVNKLPVAVVNEDAGAVANGKKINLGSDLVSSLKKSHALKCSFVDEETAEKGVQGSRYYAVITVPKDFSGDVASASKDVKKNAKIFFKPNEQHNYIATLMLRSASNEIVNNLKGKVDESITANLVEQLQTVPSKLQTLDDGLNQMGNGAQTLQNGVGSALNGQQTINSGLISLNSGLSALSSGSAQLSDKLGVFCNALTEASNGASQLNAGIQGLTKLRSGITSLNTGATGLSTGLYKLSGQFRPGSTNNLKYVADSLSSQSTGVPSYVNTINSLTVLLRKSTGVYNSILTSLVNARDVSSKEAYANALVLLTDTDNETEVSGTIAVLSSGGITSKDAITARQAALTGGGSAIEQAVSVLETQFSASGTGQPATFCDDVNRLSSGASQLAAGASSLSNAMPQLTQLQNGASNLDSALQQLNNGASSLFTGSQKLSTGLESASEGSNKLVSGSGDLSSGMNSLYQGSSKLTGAISAASRSVGKSAASAQSGLTSTKGLDTYAQNPVSFKEQDLNLVSSYGIAFAPFFISLSLWIGGILLFFGIHFDWLKRIHILTPDSQFTIVRTLIFMVLGVLQALVLGVILQHTLNLHLADIPLYYGACILFSLVSVAIIQFLIVILGDIGKLFVLMFLILSLTSSGGLFPIETVSHPFASINAFLPMTYSIDLLRQAIIRDHFSSASRDIAVECTWMAIFLIMTISTLLIKGKKAAEQPID